MNQENISNPDSQLKPIGSTGRSSLRIDVKSVDPTSPDVNLSKKLVQEAMGTPLLTTPTTGISPITSSESFPEIDDLQKEALVSI